MATLWRQLLHTETDYLDQFVAIMQTMDPLFRALKTEQVAIWIDPAQGGPYAGSTVQAYAWFADAGDAAFPERMQIVALGRYETGAPEAEVLMIGWSPIQGPANEDVQDYVIEQLLELASQWLGVLRNDGSLKVMRGVQCKEVQSRAGTLLRDRLYWRAAVEPFPATAKRKVTLTAERDLGDAFYWRAELT